MSKGNGITVSRLMGQLRFAAYSKDVPAKGRNVLLFRFPGDLVSRECHMELRKLIGQQDKFGKESAMTDQQKMQYIQYMAMKEELDNVAYGGVGLCLDGKKANSRVIAAACVFQEEMDYMRDYRRDKTGRVAELNFNKLE